MCSWIILGPDPSSSSQKLSEESVVVHAHLQSVGAIVLQPFCGLQRVK